MSLRIVTKDRTMLKLSEDQEIISAFKLLSRVVFICQSLVILSVILSVVSKSDSPSCQYVCLSVSQFVCL